MNTATVNLANVLSRLLEWCEIHEGKRDLSDESLLLAGTTLTWCFSSSNRSLRDRATKALVRLLTPRVVLLATLVQAFAEVDDPYVVERLVAAAYGCAMRSEDVEGIHAVARACYNAFFAARVPAHILLRDYARGVVERALSLRPEPVFDRMRLRPPYGGAWPTDIPSGDALKALGGDTSATVHPAQARLYYSVMADDFGRYVIGTNSWCFEWVSLPLGDPQPQSRREKTRMFVASLTPEQRTQWDRLRRAFRAERRRSLPLSPAFLIGAGDQSAGATNLPLPPHRDKVGDAKNALCALLSPEQQRILGAEVISFLEHGDQRFVTEDRFDLRLLQRYILKQAFALGWTAERFGEFDRNVDSGNRESKAERLGKKYQWLAYHDILARVADQFVFTGRSWPDEPVRFEGPWQVTGLRDIDPSMVLKQTAQDSRASRSSCWWAPPPYKDWYVIPSHTEWLQTERDLPSVATYVCVTDPADGSRWLTLEAHYSWEAPTPADREWSELSHRTVWYQLRSYVVRKQDFAELFSWAQEQSFWGRWMPESHDLYDLFLGELYWSPAYRERFKHARGERAWTRGDRSIRPPKDVIVSAVAYMGAATGRDCSMQDSVRTYVLAPWLAEHLGLRWCGVEGEFRGPDGRVIARDPSVDTAGPGALLVEEHALRAFLNAAGYEIIWTVLGGKQVIGEHPAVPAQMQLNGAFACHEGRVEGSVKGTFRQFE
ncbi:MAG: hypothetical protein HY013_05330 [Candidatus Solibacter usitatus]|nr:hypothetical protein [Candidatus Solibacter usitatus]